MVAAELLQEGIGQYDGQHRLADDPGRWHLAYVAAFVVGLYLLTRVQIDRRQRVGEGRDRFNRYPDHDIFAVGHAAFNATSAVSCPLPHPLFGAIEGLDNVVDLRA